MRTSAMNGIGAFLLSCSLFVLPCFGQELQPAGRSNLPVVQDWTIHHVIFTNETSPELAVKLRSEPRLWYNWLLRNRQLLRRRSGDLAADVRAEPMEASDKHVMPMPREDQSTMKTDWAVSLGATAGVADGVFPAKFTFDVTAAPSCANDFVVFPIAAAGSGSQANIVALNNLYRGASSGLCGTGTLAAGSATFMWAYDVGTNPVQTSPVISNDATGSKVAFIESASAASTGAVFHVLTWKSAAGNGTSATAPVVPGAGNSASVTSLSYTNAPASCAASAKATNTRSSPYVDYQHDVAYVGADNGYLFSISPVFGAGIPAVTGCIRPGGVAAVMTSPVQDPGTFNIFISDGAKLYMVNSSLALQASATVATIVSDPPIIDTTNKLAYVFADADATNKFSAVVQVPFTSTTLGTLVTGRLDGVGGTNKIATAPLHTGAFDDKYFTGGPSSGTLYACGPRHSSAARPNLYAFSFTGTAMNTTPVLNGDNNVTTQNSTCSPLTEFMNGAVDYLFFSVDGNAAEVEQWTITSQITSTGTTATKTNTTSATGGTSGVVIDNSHGSAQASSLYYGTLAVGTTCYNPATNTNVITVFCAVKLTQALLQ